MYTRECLSVTSLLNNNKHTHTKKLPSARILGSAIFSNAEIIRNYLFFYTAIFMKIMHAM